MRAYILTRDLPAYRDSRTELKPGHDHRRGEGSDNTHRCGDSAPIDFLRCLALRLYKLFSCMLCCYVIEDISIKFFIILDRSIIIIINGSC